MSAADANDRRHRVGPAADLAAGSRTQITVQGRSICVLNVEGTFYAVRNTCPHQGANLCAGTLSGSMLPSRPQEYEYGMEGSVLRCPWHGWEFDVRTGRSLFDPERTRVRTYRTEVEDGELFIEL